MRLIWSAALVLCRLCYAAFTFDQRVDNKVEQVLRDAHILGATIAVIEGESIQTKAYGWASLHPREPMQTSSLFYIGSLTKSLTAALASIVLDRSPELNWTTPVQRLLPNDFETSNTESTTHIDLESLLSHSSGIPNYNFLYIDENGPFGPWDLVRKIRTWEVIQPFSDPSQYPDSRPPFSYCNAGFVTVTCALEAWTNSTYSELMHAELFGPLGMTSTYTSLAEAGCSATSACIGLVRGYAYDQGVYLPQSWRTEPAMSGGGSVISTVGDYASFIRLMMNRASVTPLSRTGRANLTSPRVKIMAPAWSPWNADEGVQYALGWAVTQLHGAKIISHIGNVCGFSSVAAFEMSSEDGSHPGAGIVIFINDQDVRDALRLLAVWLLQEVLDVPIDQRRSHHEPEYDQCCI